MTINDKLKDTSLSPVSLKKNEGDTEIVPNWHLLQLTYHINVHGNYFLVLTYIHTGLIRS